MKIHSSSANHSHQESPAGGAFEKSPPYQHELGLLLISEMGLCNGGEGKGQER